MISVDALDLEWRSGITSSSGLQNMLRSPHEDDGSECGSSAGVAAYAGQCSLENQESLDTASSDSVHQRESSDAELEGQQRTIST